MYIQDYELLGNIHLLKVFVQRTRCRCCRKTEPQELPFKSRNHMMTTRLEDRIHRRLTSGSTLREVSITLNVHPSIVKEIDKRRLEDMQFLKHPATTRNIGIDEFLLHKGHRYATVVTDLDRGRIIYLERGKKKEQAEHFIKAMGPTWMSHVLAVSMDMNAQYSSAFMEHAPHVKIVYDKFHMVKLYQDTVLTAMRRRLQKECDERDDKAGYDLLKGSRFLILTSRENLARKEKEACENNARLSSEYTAKGLSLPPGERIMRTGMQRKLSDLLNANSGLNVAYVLLEQFKYAYDLDSSDAMQSGLKLWYTLAEQSKVPEIIKFMNTIKSNEYGLVNRVDHKISSGTVEGINNMIKTVRRKAYGFHDTDYFFLKVMAQSYRTRSTYVSHKILY